MSKRVSRVLACLALSVLSGCGGGSNPAGPTPTPVPTPRPTPVTTTVREGTFTGLGPNRVLVVPLQVLFSGEVRAVVDWTFASNDIDIAIAAGELTCIDANNVFDPRICQLAAAAAGTTKPERFTAQLNAGTYTLYIENAGPSEESLSYQVLLTYTPTSGGPSSGLASVAPRQAPDVRVARRAGAREMP